MKKDEVDEQKAVNVPKADDDDTTTEDLTLKSVSVTLRSDCENDAWSRVRRGIKKGVQVFQAIPILQRAILVLICGVVFVSTIVVIVVSTIPIPTVSIYDLQQLKIGTKDLKWGTSGRYLYFNDEDGSIRRRIIRKFDHGETVFPARQWKNGGFSDFEVIEGRGYIILVKLHKKFYNHIRLKDLYIATMNSETTPIFLFEKDVIDFEILRGRMFGNIIYTKRIAGRGYSIFIGNPDDKNQNYAIVNSPLEASKSFGVLPLLYSQAFYNDITKGFWQSPTGSHICYLEFTLPAEPLVQLPVQNGSNYSGKIRYYVPGQRIPSVVVHIYTISNSRTFASSLLEGNTDSKSYVSSVSYPDKDHVIVEFMSRKQTATTVIKCTLNPDTSCTEAGHLNRYSVTGWLPLVKSVGFSRSSTQMYVLRHDSHGGKLGYVAVYYSQRRTWANVARGNYDVVEIIGTDVTSRYLLYVRTEAISPETGNVTFNRLVYMYDGINKTSVCVSCSARKRGLNPDDEEKEEEWCTFSTAEVGPNKEYYVVKCLGPSYPYIQIRKFRDMDFRLYDEEENDVIYDVDGDTQAKLTTISGIAYRHIPVDGEYQAAVKEIKMSKTNIKKSPIFFMFNPFASEAISRYTFGIAEYLAESHSAVVIILDLGGTSGRGLSHLRIPYRNFNPLIEQAEKAIDYYIKSYNIKDISLLGYGLGGWLAIKLGQRKPTIIKSIVTLEPVLYIEQYCLSIVERYLDEPKDNSFQYSDTSLDFSSSVLWQCTGIFVNTFSYTNPFTTRSIVEGKLKMLKAHVYHTENDLLDKDIINTDPWIASAYQIVQFLKHVSVIR